MRVIGELADQDRIVSVRKEKYWGRALISTTIICVALALAAAVGLLSKELRLIEIANIIVPAGILFSTWGAAHYVIRADLNSIWRPALWYLAACGLYFGFGPLAYSFGSTRLINSLDSFYPTSSIDIIRTNLLNTVAIASSLILMAIHARIHRSSDVPRQKKSNQVDVRKIAILFLAIGLPVQYFFTLPVRFGLFPGVLPGSIFQLDQLVTVSLVPLTFLAWRRSPFWTWIWLLICFSQLSLAVFQFSKTALLQLLICIILGFAFRFKSFRMVSVGAGLSLLLLAFLTSFALTARINLSTTSGLPSRGTFSERLGTTREVARNTDFDYSGLNRLDIFWHRCCYVPPQVFVMDAYDSKDPGNTLEMGLYTLVPRFLWPEKPIISSVGSYFNTIMTGNPDSSSSPGIFGELYWKGGWLSVIIGAIVLSVILIIMGKYSHWVIDQKQWQYLPVVVLGLTLGYRVDGWLAVDYINLIPIMFGYHILLGFMGKWCRAN